jgi:hypothetical protein
MRRFIVIPLVVVAMIGAALAILWSADRGFGMQQAIEFFPYDDQVKQDDGSVIRSSGVLVRVNEREAVGSDRQIAALMVSTRQMYPTQCSGDNWEIGIRRPLPGAGGGEERYSFYHSIYEQGGAGSWIEYGRWIDGEYTVIDSYRAEWTEVAKVAGGEQPGFRIRME